MSECTRAAAETELVGTLKMQDWFAKAARRWYDAQCVILGRRNLWRQTQRHGGSKGARQLLLLGVVLSLGEGLEGELCQCAYNQRARAWLGENELGW